MPQFLKENTFWMETNFATTREEIVLKSWIIVDMGYKMAILVENLILNVDHLQVIKEYMEVYHQSEQFTMQTEKCDNTSLS